MKISFFGLGGGRRFLAHACANAASSGADSGVYIRYQFIDSLVMTCAMQPNASTHARSAELVAPCPAACHVAKVGLELALGLEVHAEKIGGGAHMGDSQGAHELMVLLRAEELVSDAPELAVAIALHLDGIQTERVQALLQARRRTHVWLCEFAPSLDSFDDFCRVFTSSPRAIVLRRDMRLLRGCALIEATRVRCFPVAFRSG